MLPNFAPHLEAFSMSDGHLFLSARGGADYAGDGRHAWFDAAHQSVLLLSPRSRQLRQLALDASEDAVECATAAPDAPDPVPLYEFNEPEAKTPNLTRSGDHRKTSRRGQPPIELLQMSVDGQLLAIQRSDIEVQVVHRATRASYWVLCKSKAGNRILHGGVLWNTHSSKPSSSQDLFLVTKHGLEQYRVSPTRRSCALHRTMGLYVHEFWYAASQGVLLVSSGSRANEIVPFRLHGTNVEKLPRLVFSTSVSKQDLHLVVLYGEMYAVYSDTRSTKLLLYLVGRTKVTCVRSLNLMLPPGTALEYSVVDNLLVCHSLDFNVSLFFDVKCDGNISDPFSAPLPISARPPGHHSEGKTALAETTVSTKSIDVFKKFDDDESDDGRDQEPYDDPSWGSPQPTLSIRRALSVDDLDVHRYIDDACLPSPSFKTSPASHLANRRSARRLQRAMSAANLDKVEPSNHEIVVPGLTRWRFHAPNFVQRSLTANGHRGLIEKVEIRKLQVNLFEICKTCERHPEILPFLLRRGDHEQAKLLILKLVRNHIVEQHVSLSAVAQLLSMVQTESRDDRHNKNSGGSDSVYDSRNMSSLRAATLGQHATQRVSTERYPVRNARGFLLIQQAEFYRHVWSSILQPLGTAKNSDLSVYIIEYIKNLRESGVPVENITYVALAESFIAVEQPLKLYQFLHYHVVADSVELAELMVRNGRTHEALMQVGLDMYFRLGLIGPLVCTLLDLGEIARAIEIAWRNMGLSSCDASAIPAATFFDSFVKAVTSPKPPRSSLQITHMLGNLILFLKVWDSAALQSLSATSLSTLASTATVPFPDSLVSPNCCAKLRAAFGFATE